MSGGSGRGKMEEQDGVSVHSPCKPPPSSLPKEQQQVEVELRLLEALEIYPPVKLHACIATLSSMVSWNSCSEGEVLQLLDRFYNLEVLKPDDEEADILNHEEDFSLPPSYFVEEES